MLVSICTKAQHVGKKTEAHQRNVAQLNRCIETADNSFKGNPAAEFAFKNSLAF
jgi:hypothetical protein